ncbi:HET-domain-containing protein [Cenococcum geophilum 1.58]|uniref:HET-domain-containing protein n=1 Tax=Cenococcum geophilum 1.58 TaxID=794803 RepID=UPI00358DE551|nr:HET-domain-containing protein [Cenococcum geophilum 1.58]
MQGCLPYLPLPGASSLFRLLVLEPGADEDKIVCHLRPCNIKSNICYEALSYVWGDPHKRQEIVLNGFPFQGTVNLVSALQHLRSNQTCRTLWVDALCINQESLSERNEQVRRMTEIYKHAQRTLVWLGEWFDVEDVGLKPESIQNFLNKVIELSQADELSSNSLQEKCGVQWFACYVWITEVFKKPWFTRLWVLQEAAVAQEVNFICGRATFTWKSLIQGFFAFETMSNSWHLCRVMIRRNESRLKAIILSRDFVQNEEDRNAFSRASLPDRILSLLLLSTGQLVTDQKDYLYALLGLAGPMEETQQESSLRIDYRSSPEEVLTRLAVYLLKSTRDLSLLYCAPYQPNLNVPSWVPTCPGKRSWSLTYYFNPRTPLYRNTNFPLAEIIFSDDDTFVEIKGCLVGHVTVVGRPAENSDCDTFTNAKALFEEWERDILQPLEDSVVANWVQAILGDQFDRLTASQADLDTTGINIWCDMLFHSRAWDEPYDNFEHLKYMAVMGHTPLTERGLEIATEATGEFLNLEMQRLRQGAPFATSSGLIGFFDDARVLEHYSGATICVFQGCRIPFIISGGPEEYFLLGPCYLQPFIDSKTLVGYPDLIKLI